MPKTLITLLVLLSITASAIARPPAQRTGVGALDDAAELRRPNGLETALIYEVNLRHHTPEGTMDAFREDIPRLKDLGVDVLWLMPIHPIGEVKRKGTLGSPYSVLDYTEVNPEFGTKEDLNELVKAARDAGMLVILDLVANHTAWDHPWIEDHPEWYARDEQGAMHPPIPEWDDIAQLDMGHPGVREAMKDAMLYWVREHDIDGYRADYVEAVPADFWREAIGALREEKPVFMLAEGGADWLFDCGFDATYGWGLTDSVRRVYADDRPARIVTDYIRTTGDLRRHPRRPMRMHFTTNHDWNAWDGVARRRLGDAWECAAVLTFTVPGIPMIYTGQDAGLDERLEFFEKDEVEWRDHPHFYFFRRLADFKERVPALRAGDPAAGIRIARLPNPDRVVGFHRRNKDSEVLVYMNLAETASPVSDPYPLARYRDIDGNAAEFPESLGAWEWVVLEVVER